MQHSYWNYSSVISIKYRILVNAFYWRPIFSCHYKKHYLLGILGALSLKSLAVSCLVEDQIWAVICGERAPLLSNVSNCQALLHSQKRAQYLFNISKTEPDSVLFFYPSLQITVKTPPPSVGNSDIPCTLLSGHVCCAFLPVVIIYPLHNTL